MTKDELIAKLKELRSIKGDRSDTFVRSALVIQALLNYINKYEVTEAVDYYLYTKPYEK